MSGGIRIIANFEAIFFQLTIKLKRAKHSKIATKSATTFVHCWRVIAQYRPTYLNLINDSSKHVLLQPLNLYMGYLLQLHLQNL